MTTPNIFTMNDAVLTIASTNFELAVDEIRAEISTATAQWNGVGGNVLPYLTETTTTVKLSYPQDWKTADSLSNYLLAHHGELQEVVFTPQTGGAAFKMQVRMLAGGIGGSANQLASAAVTLPASFPQKVTAGG